MQHVARQIEELMALGVPVPPFPTVRIPPSLLSDDPGATPLEEVQAAQQLQQRIEACRAEVMALHAKHIGNASS